MKGVECLKALVLQCFLGPSPLIKGVEVHPPQLRGYGLSGNERKSGAPKRTPKPKNRTNSTKHLSEQFEGGTGHYPIKQGF